MTQLGSYGILTNCRSYPRDEAPAAYKDFDEVLGSVKQAGLAREVARVVMHESVCEEAGIAPGVAFEVIVVGGRIELRPVEMPTEETSGAGPRAAKQAARPTLKELLLAESPRAEIPVPSRRRGGAL